jgi:diadenosine tetraphosphate (Ap4A) HIT family hydrolase
MSCELCATTGETLLWGGKNCRVILVDDADFPGFCRVIWNEHIKEMTDLSAQMREEFMQTVFAVESAVREVMQPEKINLASLGNLTPHLHWHVIPRFRDDKCFPSPVWSAPVRTSRVSTANVIRARLSASILKNITA